MKYQGGRTRGYPRSRERLIARLPSVTPYQPQDFEPHAALLKEIAGQTDWERVKDRGGDRIVDTWAPLLVVDSLIGGDWGIYAAEEMEKASADLDLGHGEEPTQAVYSAFLSLAISGDTIRRVRLLEIGRRLLQESELSSWQIGSILRSLGFETKKAGGDSYAYPESREKLVEVGQGLGIEDEWFDDVDAAKPVWDSATPSG